MTNSSILKKEKTIRNVINSLQIPITDIKVKQPFVNLDQLGIYQLLLRDQKIGNLPYQDGFFGAPMFYSDQAKIDWNAIYELEKSQIKNSVVAYLKSDAININPSTFPNTIEIQQDGERTILFCYFREGNWVIFK